MSEQVDTSPEDDQTGTSSDPSGASSPQSDSSQQGSGDSSSQDDSSRQGSGDSSQDDSPDQGSGDSSSQDDSSTKDSDDSSSQGNSSDQGDSSSAEPAAPTGLTLSADPQEVNAGGKVTLSWNFSGDFDAVTIDPGGLDVAGDTQADSQGNQSGSREIDTAANPPEADGKYTLSVSPKGGGDAVTATAQVTVQAFAPKFDPDKTGLRKRGEAAGGASLTVAQGEVVEVYWSVDDADMVKLVRDDQDVGEPDRASDESGPLKLDGLDPGEYTFQLVCGNAVSGEELWSTDTAVSLTLSLRPPIAVTKFEGAPEPDDDGKDHPPRDLQLAQGTKVKLSWETTGAKQVIVTATPDGGTATDLDAQDVDDSGAGSLVVDPGDQATSYSIMAVDGDLKSDPEGPVAVDFHAPDDVVSPKAIVHPPASGILTIVGFDDSGQEIDGDGRGRISIGAGDEVKLNWKVAGAKSARITARLLVDKKLEKGLPKPESSRQADNLAIVEHGVDLELGSDGTGSGQLTMHPPPEDSTEYALEVTPFDEDAEKVTSIATARVANFNLQLKLPDGGEVANKACVLEVPDQDPFKGETSEDGELWLNLPNIDAPHATIRMFDGSGTEIGTWLVKIEHEKGIEIGATLDNGDAAADSGDGSSAETSSSSADHDSSNGAESSTSSAEDPSSTTSASGDDSSSASATAG